MEKLYNLYSVISNKTVRPREKCYRRYRGHKSVPGSMIKTNRGYFIDGHEVDKKSVETWFNLVKSAKNNGTTI